MLPHLFQRRLRLDVADDRDDGVVGRVVRLEKRRDVFDRRGVEIGHRTDHRVFVGGVVVGELVAHLERPPVRLVVDAQPPLFLHRVPLVLEVLSRDLERSHPVGFEKQREIELVGRQGLVIDRPVLAGRPVHVAAA